MVNLRPDLVIKQEFVADSPNVADPTLPVLLIGVNRAFNYQTDLGIVGWTGASVVTSQALPNWGGGVVHAVDDAVTLMQPKIYASTSVGVAELTTGVTFANLVSAPEVSIAAGASATFEMAAGSSGTFAIDTITPLASQFVDASADFIASQVADGDIIKVGGYEAYAVAAQGLVADDELAVTRLDKGSSRFAASQAAKYFLSEEDSDGLRQMTTLSTGYSTAGGFNSTGVMAGDEVNVDYHTVSVTNAGIDFTKVGTDSALDTPELPEADERMVTLPDTAGYENDAVAAWNNTAGTGGVWFLQTDAGNYEPAFYATTAVDGSSQLFVKDFATNKLTDLENMESVVAQFYDYAAVGTVSTAGSFTLVAAGTRTFTDLSVDFGALAVVADDHIAVKDIDGVYRPVLVVVSQDTATQLTVAPIGTTMPDALVASNVEYKIVRDAVNTEGTPAALAAANGTNRYTVTATALFGAGVAAGDLMFIGAGELAAIVVEVTSSTVLLVEAHPNAGVVLADYDGSSISFSTRTSAPTSFTVTRVVSDGVLELLEETSSPNPMSSVTTTAQGFISFQTAPVIGAGPAVTEFGSDIDTVVAADSAASLSYTIEKTLSGSALTGTVLVSYVEDRNDIVSEPTQVTDATYAAVTGPAVPENPLGLAASIVAQNTDTAFYVLQVPTDDSAGWTSALANAQVSTVYSVVPVTADAAFLTLTQAHVDEQSLPDTKRLRIMWQSQEVLPQDTRLVVSAADGTLLSKSAVGVQTVVVPQDLTAQQVVVGDVFSGVASNGTLDVAFSGRITIIAVLGGITTLTMIASADIANSTADQVVSSWDIKSKALTPAEHADAVKDYLISVSNRRVRNIFPYTAELTITDTTGGFYVDPASSDQTIADVAVGGQYMAAMEAAKKATYGPVRPLTGIAGAGFTAVNDPFAGNMTLQDVIIDNGGYYVEQRVAGGAITAIRALTTDVTDFKFLEESVTTQVDTFARRLQDTLRPLIGPMILDARAFDVISTAAEGVRTRTLADKTLKSIKMLKIYEDPSRPDGFMLDYTVGVYFSAAHGEITITV